MTLEKQIDRACEHLPEGWRIRIDIEKHSGTVTAIRPDESEVDMGDGESDLAEQVASVVRLSIDERRIDLAEAARWRVVLEDGVWLADGVGDPARTLVQENAAVWRSRRAAQDALEQARKFRLFANAYAEGFVPANAASEPHRDEH